MENENQNVIGVMTNVADSGQEEFVQDWTMMAKTMLHEQGISNAYLNSNDAQYLLAKAVTDLIEDGNFTSTTLSLIATLRINHPHSEDKNVQTL
jgi:hypothetical protein